MAKQSIIKIFKKYQKTSNKKRQGYFHAFEKKMLYRTTKTENPKTTQGMVQQVLNKLGLKV
ncbi:hypothetical protein L6279_01130 [Candidatus Parcubacteria bacterium]|nr:hypothetical protein [Candidatus Parcubacteria bacterium]